MGWRQYDNLIDDIKNVAFKSSLAPLFRKLNASHFLNSKGLFPKRIVICGSPRSGTTLMNELMRCYSDVYVMNREEYALRFPYLFIKEKYIVTKHPLDFKNFSKIIATYTDPFFIFLLRDPRDVIISKHYKNQDTYLITYPTWEEAIQAYEHLEYDKKLLVRYENLITQPALVQTQISTKLDLDAIRNFEQFYRNVSKGHQDIKSLGEARPLDSNNAGKFKRPEHFERIKQQLQQFPTMHEYLVKYGYENDDTWKSHFLGNH